MKQIEAWLKKFRPTHLSSSRLSRSQTIALSFLGVIAAGTCLLMLPWATRAGETTNLLEAAFTAVSATCVTGLIVVDTFQHWTLFGQLVILIMIQIGGLGFMTFSVWFALMMRRRIGLKERELLQESVNTQQIGGIIRLVRKILLGTLIFEGTGAILLSVRFVPEFGWGKGIYYGFFHSVSAFCNAGFDLMGTRKAFSSLTGYASDPLVNLTIMALIVIGGIGFLVWDDISNYKWKFRKYRLHSKLALTMSFLLIFGGAFLFFLMERGGVLAGKDASDMIWSSLFQSVTTRTAGFNTLDIAGLRECTKLLMIALMFIGGSPGSTAGGVKTTTVAALLLYLRSLMRKDKGVEVFGRRLEEDTIKRAGSILSLSLFLDVTAAIILAACTDIALSDVLFEVCSALGTVGITAGLTPGLPILCKIVLMLLMYCGRMGSLTFALVFTENRKNSLLQKPVERIPIG